ncbi:phenylalanyl-tRNA synthetase, alpha subunit [Hymenobacter daecheongensis DSM 21074]|uniref:Phenylalanine--tRNA ligase alpha subunit n=1 Tax=Hymenobacter daecheongensis DSM 21074 TaxID=1121955 RepID=A0A1M6J4I7_9BACT|nr:phenylalanine--tRNA ligase subunit alpha [Hymenobacter daecheongensis]SHJ41634.1 phenylalanyl-tRNA synthetase, alpha subunit [Hymenobacter daecheongensis DSM 21074]
MQDQINRLRAEIAAYDLTTPEQLEQFRLAFTGRKGQLADLFDQLKTVAPEQRRAVGQELNQLKQAALERFEQRRQELEEATQNTPADPTFDYTLPTVPNVLGTRHPLSLVREEMVRIFSRIGFNVAEGPEIEDDWHNFTALNFPENHPARDMQDTFFVARDAANPTHDFLLRTHTSTVQVRVMESQKPPIRSIMPGRVYRNEAISARAHMMFHQIEGIFIDEGVSFADLKQTVYYFVQEMFGADIQIRFRPSFFPFTEPSAEIDITCLICKGTGCNICKHTGWVEIGGCGMVDPNVLTQSGIDPEVFSGYAWGMGIERITMLKYQIKDLRLFTENDQRFLRQFEGA